MDIDAKQYGVIGMKVDDTNWYKPSNLFIEFLPAFEKEDFKLHIYRDTDNVLKFVIRTYWTKETILTFSDLGRVIKKETHPRHSFLLHWGKEDLRLYIDGELVDRKESSRAQ